MATATTTATQGVSKLSGNVNPTIESWILEYAPQNNDPELNVVYNFRLGDAVVPYLLFNSLSIFFSVVIISVVITMSFVNREVALRPSFRLSGSIAGAHIIISSLDIVQTLNRYMQSLTELQIRAILWMSRSADLSFHFLSVCIVLQLLLSVLINKPRIANRINPYYEVVSILVPLILNCLTMFLYNVAWIRAWQNINTFAYTAEGYNGFIYPTYRAWKIASWVFMVVVCTWAILRLFPLWRQFRSTLQGSHNKEEIFPDPDVTKIEISRLTNAEESLLPYSSPGSNANDIGNNVSILSIDRRATCRKTRNTILRLMLYPLNPIVCSTLNLVVTITQSNPELYISRYLLSSFMGTFTFIAFLLNPGTEEFWNWLVSRKCIRSFIKK